MAAAAAAAPLAFEAVVTLNQLHAHSQCIKLQLNRWLVDGRTTARADYWKEGKGGEAGAKGECGKSGVWGHCTKWDAAGKPAPLRDIPQAPGDFDWIAKVNDAVAGAIGTGTSQDFQDGNHRTALLRLFEAISYAGLFIVPTVDYFRLYVHLKSLTEDVGEFKEQTPQAVTVAMTKLMKDVVRIHPKPGDKSPVKWENRMALAQLVKTDLAQSLADVEALRKRIDDAVKGKSKEEKWKITKEILDKVKMEQPKLYSRFKFLYPSY